MAEEKTPEAQPEQSFEAFEASEQAGKDTAPAPAEEKPAGEETPSDDGDKPAETDGDSETPPEQEAEGEGDDKKDEQPEQPKPKHKGGVQKRMDKLTRARREAEAETAELRRQLADHIQAAAKPPETPPATVDGEPNPESYDAGEYDSQYIKDLGRWSAKQEIQQWKQEQEQGKQQEAAEARQGRMAEQADAAREAHEDFDEVLEAGDDIQVSAALRDALVDSDNLPNLQYHLAKHPKEVTRLNALSPLATARELGKLEAQLTTPPAKVPATPKATASKAPPPVSPVGGGKAKSAPALTGEMSFEQFEPLEKRRLA